MLIQSGIWLGLPIVVALFASSMFTVCFIRMVSAAACIGFGALFAQTAIIGGILILLPVCYFLSTWILFRRLIWRDCFPFFSDPGDDARRRLWPVHRIKVNAVHTVLFQIAYLTDHIVDACLAHVVFVISVSRDDIRQLFRNGGAG